MPGWVLVSSSDEAMLALRIVVAEIGARYAAAAQRRMGAFGEPHRFFGDGAGNLRRQRHGASRRSAYFAS